MKAGAGLLAQRTISKWLDDHAFRLSAALAYYSLFSLAPLLVLFIGVAGILFGPEAVQGRLDEEIASLVGPDSAVTIQSMVQSISNRHDNLLAGIIGGAVLLFAAGGVFGQLKDALNTIWGVKPKPGHSLLHFVRDRFLSYAMVLGTGFLLLVSLIITTLLSAFSKRLESTFPLPPVVWLGLSFLISFCVVTLLFAMIFKYLPDVCIRWSDVWIGAAATALLFDLGKFLLAFYLGRESTASSYGAAGAVIILLMWVYYASAILLLGAEFTQVWAEVRGRKIRPDPHAVLI
jgi:membrane protein